jgi:hypothetical protein
MPDEFDQSLEQLIKSTIDLYEESAATQYFPMMRCARGDEIRYVLLAPEDDDFVEPDDWTEFFRSAAENAARLRRPAPDILHVLWLSRSPAGESIVIHGASPDGRTNAAELPVFRNEHNQIRLTKARSQSSGPMIPNNARTLLLAWVGSVG